MKSALLFVAMVMLAQASPPQPPLPDIAAAAARYEKGEHAAALAMLSGSRLTAGALMAGLDRWVTAGDAATISRRQIVAATLGLDTVWTATRALWLNHQRANLDPWGRVTPSEPERTGISNFVAQSHIGAKCGVRDKGVQRLIGCLATLSWFISRLAERGMPLYKLLKKTDAFV